MAVATSSSIIFQCVHLCSEPLQGFWTQIFIQNKDRFPSIRIGIPIYKDERWDGRHIVLSL